MKKVRQFIIGVRGEISGKRGSWVPLAKYLLSQVEYQLSELATYIDEERLNLVTVAEFTDTSAWILIGRSVRAVFDEMGPYRAAVGQIEDIGTGEARSKFIWAVFQNHLVWRRIIDKGFRAFPAVVAETTLFMLTERVDPTTVDRLKKRIAEVELMKAEVESVKAENKVLKNRVNDLQNEFKQLKKKT